MAYKNFLIHIDDSKACADRIQAAIALAQAHEAHLIGLYIATDPVLPGNIRAEIPTQFLAVLEDQLAERTEAAKARFIEVVERAGFSAECRAVQYSGMGIAEVIGLHARYTDLVVLGQPDENRELENHIAEDVVLSSGRPALVVPYIGAGKTMGERVMIAWDAGREAARAVHDALPVLERAKSVVILVLGGVTRQLFQQMTVPVLMSH